MAAALILVELQFTLPIYLQHHVTQHLLLLIQAQPTPLQRLTQNPITIIIGILEMVLVQLQVTQPIHTPVMESLMFPARYKTTQHITAHPTIQ